MDKIINSMAQARNNFVKSKMNKDLDARLLPGGEYRNASNIQVSKSEGPNVGSLENVLGNISVLNITSLINNVGKSKCIGQVVDENSGFVYLFITDNNSTISDFNIGQNNFIIRFDSINEVGLILVKGAFLNFNFNNPIYGVNLLEGLLFWTDNNNQPRVINVDTAASDVDFYTTEDQISVAKYNPYQAIELWQEVDPTTTPSSYETTMQDVTTPYLPLGGTGVTTAETASGATSVSFTTLVGNIPLGLGEGGITYGRYFGISYIDDTNSLVDTGAKINGPIFGLPATGSFTYDEATKTYTLNFSSTYPTTVIIPNGATLVMNPNPYYNGQFAGDPNYLEDKFVRFSYRYKFVDNEYSIFAPFTQIAFIPKQDGYFLYIKNPSIGRNEFNDQDSAYRSTVVGFVENKVDLVKLRIPLPFSKSTLQNSLKITEIDILYKESNGLAVKVIDTIPIADITSDPLVDPNIFTYDYISKKPYKTLPSDALTRVYDKVPVKAFSQEIASNRVIYGNFQDKHTPPDFIDYSVNVGAKSDFNLNVLTGTVDGDQTVAAGVSVSFNTFTTVPLVGSIVSGTGISTTLVTTVTSITADTVTFDQDTDFLNGAVVTFNLVGSDTDTVTKIEYPNSTLKQNRNYQVGVMLSDRYGRTSTVVLSNNKTEIRNPNGLTFVGDTLYSPYLSEATRTDEWPGNSLKVLFNQPIGPVNSNPSTGWPGIYNGDSTSKKYNPLGWYSYKIVVKQTEQEYYNVYLPGIMAAYPEDVTLELGKTSHTVLINDNINKVPRDLTEVGPDQKQFRSSVNLFGRVQNTNTPIIFNQSSDYYQNVGEANSQYYPNRGDDVVSTISTLGDLFDYSPTDAPQPDLFPQFYLYESNPLIARISTEKQIGQIATTNYSPVSAEVAINSTSDEIFLKNVIGEGPSVTGTINGLQTSVPAGTPAIFNTFTTIPSVGSVAVGLGISPDTNVTAATTTSVTFDKATQFLDGTTVTFTLVEIALGDSVRGGGLPSDTIVITPGFTPATVAVNPIPTTAGVSDSNIIIVNDATGIEPNQYVTATGVPEGTVVDSISGLNVTLSNVVNIGNAVPVTFNTPAKIKVGRLDDSDPPVPVATPVTVTFDSLLTIVNEETPGLQYLAVMETEPVESLLDIFWETTSTGLITDLNTIIENSGGINANFSSFNITPFIESLADGANILSAAFTLVDAFGAAIAPADITSFTIQNVLNGNGTNVNNYFQLYEPTPGSGFFNIKTTTSYYNNVFYGSNSSLRTFTFTFSSTITISTDVTNTLYNETINLDNVDPSISSAVPAINTTIYTNRYDQDIAVLTGVNGANNTSLRTQDLDWEIVSVINTTSSPGVDLKALGYFTLPTSIVSTEKKAELLNSSGGNMPPEVWEVNLKLSDPLNEITFKYTVDMLIEPASVISKTWQILCDGESFADSFFSVIIEITDGQGNQNGWYLFPRSWNQITNASGSTVVTIDRTNARTTNPAGAACPVSGQAFFSATSSADVQSLWTSSDCTCSGTAGSIISSSNVDITGYLFEII